jgi:hypothetical protein
MPDLTPIPDDAALAEHLRDRITEDTGLMETYLGELGETIEDCEIGGMPIEFAYGKMLNKFREIDPLELVCIASAAMWKLHGQENAEVTALRTETDSGGDTQIDGASRPRD